VGALLILHFSPYFDGPATPTEGNSCDPDRG
jgi:hypothetical protein